MQNYKSLCVALYATLVNIQTDRHKDGTVNSLYDKLSQLSLKTTEYVTITKIMHHAIKTHNKCMQG